MSMNPYALGNRRPSANIRRTNRLLYLPRRAVWSAVAIAVIISLPAIISGLASQILLPILLVIVCTVVVLELALRMRAKLLEPADPDDSRILEDGYERAIDEIDAEIRPDVEQKYADEWNAAGLIKRWFLLRKIEREIEESVAKRAEHISPDSLF